MHVMDKLIYLSMSVDVLLQSLGCTVSKRILNQVLCPTFLRAKNLSVYCFFFQNGKEDKFSVIRAIWTPPAEMTGRTVTFVATVVQKFDLWWRGIESNTIDLI
jgi:hypothetical protein